MTGWLTPLLPPAQAANYLGVSLWTLARLRRGGHLTAVRVGNAWRYDPTDLTAYVTRHKTGANT
jgi:excisionase family DNA binding protein